MGAYLARRIMGGHLDYAEVAALYPQFKKDIDKILKEQGHEKLIVKTEKK